MELRIKLWNLTPETPCHLRLKKQLWISICYHCIEVSHCLSFVFFLACVHLNFKSCSGWFIIYVQTEQERSRDGSLGYTQFITQRQWYFTIHTHSCLHVIQTYAHRTSPTNQSMGSNQQQFLVTYSRMMWCDVLNINLCSESSWYWKFDQSLKSSLFFWIPTCILLLMILIALVIGTEYSRVMNLTN